ncbi:hypothetical protein EUGRSUZ_K00554 [Eucalyptus grandis]|uniref:Uncharacterized protein n=2 Tax=Eucalyptus grandis TaxID=71139 RepID=A0ACC3IQN1_EUCGR|nr:hypothetical protein EUGRSUZ_K00554 [Eucalyptus grandis]
MIFFLFWEIVFNLCSVLMTETYWMDGRKRSPWIKNDQLIRKSDSLFLTIRKLFYLNLLLHPSVKESLPPPEYTSSMLMLF